MFIGFKIEKTQHTRTSKSGVSHTYKRKKTFVELRCDNCGEVFLRPKGSMSPNRLSNRFFHCCSSCDPKRFAQKKGAERKIIWNRPVSSLDDISKL